VAGLSVLGLKTFGEFTTKWIAYTAGENRLVLKGAL